MRFVFSWLSRLKCLQTLSGRVVWGADSLTLFTWGGFRSLLVGQNIRILEFFGSDLHLDFCTRGCPTPWQSLAEACFFSSSDSHCIPHNCESKPSSSLSHLSKKKSSEVPKQHFLNVSLLHMLNHRQKKQKTSFRPYFSCAVCGVVCGAPNLVFILSAPPWLKYNGLGAGLWLLTHSADSMLCRQSGQSAAQKKSLDVSAKAALNPIIRP